MDFKRENFKTFVKARNRPLNTVRPIPNSQTFLLTKETNARKEKPAELVAKPVVQARVVVPNKDLTGDPIDFSTKLKEHRALLHYNKNKLRESIPDKVAMDKMVRLNPSVENLKRGPGGYGSNPGSLDNKKAKSSVEHDNWLAGLKQSCQKKLEQEDLLGLNPSKPLYVTRQPLYSKATEVVKVKNIKDVRSQYGSNTENKKARKMEPKGYQIDFCNSSEDSMDLSNNNDRAKLLDTPFEGVLASRDQTTVEMRRRLFEVIREDSKERCGSSISKTSNKIVVVKPDFETDIYKPKDSGSILKTDTQSTLGGYRTKLGSTAYESNITTTGPTNRHPLADKVYHYKERQRTHGLGSYPVKKFANPKLEKIGASIKKFKLEADNKYLNFKVTADNNFQELLHIKKYLDVCVKAGEKRLMGREEQLAIQVRMQEHTEGIGQLETVMEGLSRKVDINNEMVKLNNGKTEIDAEVGKIGQELHGFVELAEEMGERKCSLEGEIDDLQQDIDKKAEKLSSLIASSLESHHAFIARLGLAEDEEQAGSSDLNRLVNAVHRYDCQAFKYRAEAQLDQLLQREYENSEEFALKTGETLMLLHNQLMSKLKMLKSELVGLDSLSPDCQEMGEHHMQEAFHSLYEYYTTFKDKFNLELSFDKLTLELEELEAAITKNQAKVTRLSLKEAELSKQSGDIAAQKIDLKWKHQKLGVTKNFDEMFSLTRVNNYDQNLILNGELVECNLHELRDRVEKDRRKLDYVSAKVEVLTKMLDDNKMLVRQLAADCCLSLDDENRSIESLLKAVDNPKSKELKEKHEANFGFIINLRVLMAESGPDREFIRAVCDLRAKLKTVVDREYNRIDRNKQTKISDKEFGSSKVTFSYKNPQGFKKNDTLSSLNDTLTSGIKSKQHDIYKDVVDKQEYGSVKVKGRKAQ